MYKRRVLALMLGFSLMALFLGSATGCTIFAGSDCEFFCFAGD